jgi:DNA-binding MarR family transcriptional regulator
MTAHRPVPSEVELAILLRRAQLRKQTACEAELAELDLTLPQWGMLHAVANVPDASTHALALYTGQSDQAAGAVVARLQQRGLLERRSEGGRAILHRLTKTGDELVKRGDVLVSEVMGRLVSQFSAAQRTELAASLEALAAWPLGDQVNGRPGRRPATQP